MTITEELRTMLDNQGVKWDEILDHENMMIGTRWKDSRGYFVIASAYADCPHIKTFTDFFWQPTPKEAVDATLGRGTCKVERRGSLANWSDMVCWSCSECGFGWHHSVNDRQFNYCPNCGCKVVDS